jgi:lysophospholipase L1-like esterase
MKVICFGDSNTYGYDPRGPFGSRYDRAWPDILAELTGWQVINQGENGREIPKSTIFFPEDTDLLIMMLGTNDLLQFWSPDDACEKMNAFLKSVTIPVLLLAPPPMTFGAWVEDQELIDDRNTLADHYRELAGRLGIGFADPGTWNIPLAFDGVHLTESGHRAFARGLYHYLIKGD